jgi:hypothetical protein
MKMNSVTRARQCLALQSEDSEKTCGMGPTWENCEWGRSEAIALFQTLARVGREIWYVNNSSCLRVSSLKLKTVRDPESNRKTWR